MVEKEADGELMPGRAKHGIFAEDEVEEEKKGTPISK